MGSIKTSTGLASGLDTAALIQAILTNNSNAVTKLQGRQRSLQAGQTGLTQIQAGLLSIASSAQQLSTKSTFQSIDVQNTDPQQLAVTTGSGAVPGVYQFQAVRLATTDQSVSRGFADAGQALGLSGQLVISKGGSLSRPTSLDLLNQGAGVRRGVIRITDRSGQSASLDLSQALTVDDVVQTINRQTSISVHAATQGGKLILQDTTGLSASNLSVVEVNGGHAAADLGIAQSVAGSTLNGATVFQVSSDVLLTNINDGNGLRTRANIPDLAIGLKDGTSLQVSLNGTKTVGDVVQKITAATGNGGKLTASLTNGRLQLTDTTAGAGAFTVASASGSNAVEVLGLNNAVAGNVLTGKSLSGGLNTVLLRNLRGGQGIETPGQISLTDRTGATATIDLSQAESLDDVLSAINSAETVGNVKLQLQAALDAKGTGLVITDTSGQSASHLVIADVGGGTVARDLNLAVNLGVTSVTSGSLGLRSVNEATSLSSYAPNGGAVSPGSFSITNSAGDSAVITVGSTAQTVGDILDRINSAGINVTARLNDTGDGFVLVDNAAGAGTLKVQTISGLTTSDLRLTGTVTTGGDGKQRITSRNAAIVQVTAEDTLTTLSTKINSAGGIARSSVIDSGAAINPFRLNLTANGSGEVNRLIIDDGNLGINFARQVAGQDAVLRIGNDSATAFLKRSGSNSFQNAITGYNVTLLKPGDEPAIVSGTPNSSPIGSALSSLVKNYNQLSTQIDSLTKYDPLTQVRGPLQGNATVLQIRSRILGLVNRVSGNPASPVRSLADAGVVVGAGGQLTFDQFRFQQAFSDHPQEVTALFADSKTGIGTLLNKTLTDLTDNDKGTLAVAIKADKSTTDNLQNQIDRVNATMNARRAFLETRFTAMESLLSGLQSQQSALTALANLAGTTTSSKSK